jgi:hypothetical protein
VNSLLLFSHKPSLLGYICQVFVPLAAAQPLVAAAASNQRLHCSTAIFIGLLATPTVHAKGKARQTSGRGLGLRK